MPKICLSYRRSESAAITGRIFDRLVSRYGNDSVFLDIESIPYGKDFHQHIQDVLHQVDVLVAVVGPKWLGPQEGAIDRIHDEKDPIRIEVQTALYERVFVIPVLVEGATMPIETQVPEPIREFTYRNAVRVDSTLDFHAHVDRLIKSIDAHVGHRSTRQSSEAMPRIARTSNDVRISSHIGSGPPIAGFSLSCLLLYVVVPLVLLLVAHYLVVLKLDLDTIYLRFITIAVPLTSGFILYRKSRMGLLATLLLGMGVGFLSVVGMLSSVALVDTEPLLPSARQEWQELVEYLASIVLATVSGNVLARAAYSMPS